MLRSSDPMSAVALIELMLSAGVTTSSQSGLPVTLIVVIAVVVPVVVIAAIVVVVVVFVVRRRRRRRRLAKTGRLYYFQNRQ